MPTQHVATSQAFRYGWAEVKKNFWYFVGLAAIVLVIESVGTGYDDDGTLFNILGPFLSAWMACGYLTIILDYYGGTMREITDVFTQFTQYWRVLGATIVVCIIVALGFIALVIPGIYLALRFMFTVPLIIDKKLDIGEAMKQSTAMTDGIKWSLFGFGLTALGVIILGAICLGVGIFVAMPVVWLAFVYLYKTLHGVQPSASVQPMAQTAASPTS
ncbi:MAG: glycerophosphoryl diester phosphodiesterase membrane domain-containing protein [Patescibacteria group bacterium]|nr:glycerophosphoryl diester phosphodiesterase membrane domain-containing protein [Patescibacteria group bacterium]MDD5715773.1 glycerophosphoryl diester phosphodiesterase membrane domain-containing protein [Patescibacteria group bacterium]